MALLAIDSTGKLSSKQYCGTVCESQGWLEPIYAPGATLVDLIYRVVQSPNGHHTLCIISNANGVVDMTWAVYNERHRLNVQRAVSSLAQHIGKNSVSKHLILFGADVKLFEGAKFPDDYSLIQKDILNMLSSAGINAGTGMESHYGDFGRFQGKLNSSWHIEGIYRDAAIAWLKRVLAATSQTTNTTMNAAVKRHKPCCDEARQAGPRPDTLPARVQGTATTSFTNGTPSCSNRDEDAAKPQSVNFDLLQENDDKQKWIKFGRERCYKWPILEPFSPKVVMFPVDHEEGTVLVCTSDDVQTRPQADLTCQMLHYLGWRPHIIKGIKRWQNEMNAREDTRALPPKGWKIGCRATFAWFVALMPQIQCCANNLESNKFLMVVEDSCWPSNALTPKRVCDELQKREKALWLAAKLKPKVYKHTVGATEVSARAASGTKCLCGDKVFWQKVQTLFRTSDKNTSTDAIFQTMVALGELHMVHPFLGATMPHVSTRTGQVDSGNLAASDIDGELPQLPKEYLTYVTGENVKC